MSVEAVSWALNVPIGGNAKVVLLGLANHANAELGDARPAVNTLARYAHVDRRSVQRILRKLEQDGWIEQDGWHLVQGRKDRKVAVWNLTGRQNVTPTKNGATSVRKRGDTAVANGATLASPEPSKEPSKERRAAAASAREAGDLWGGVPDDMLEDAHALIKSKRKVDERLVSAAEMQIAARALAEFNRQMETDFGLGANLRCIVMRVRERPSWDAAKHVRLVQSACRLRWWERTGSKKRAAPNVIFGNSRVFEQVAQDAKDEAAGKPLQHDVDLRSKVWPDGRRFDDLTPVEQRNARESLAMGILPWLPQQAPANGNGNGSGKVLRTFNSRTLLEAD